METTKLTTRRLNMWVAGWKIAMDRFLTTSVRSGACAAAAVVALSAPSVLADETIYRYISPDGTLHLTDVPVDSQSMTARPKPHYHTAVSDQEIEGAVARSARDNQLSPALLLAVMKAESNFNPMAISKAGAVGLMQLIPETAIRHGVKNLYDAGENVAGGARHLRYLLDRFHGNVRLALAAYNAGERHVERYRQIPPFKETRTYVRKVMGFYRTYRATGFVNVPNSFEGVTGIQGASLKANGMGISIK